MPANMPAHFEFNTEVPVQQEKKVRVPRMQGKELGEMMRSEGMGVEAEGRGEIRTRFSRTQNRWKLVRLLEWISWGIPRHSS